MNNRILIIGGLGFIGKNLYLNLKENNFDTVDILNNTELNPKDPFAKLFRNKLIIGSIENNTLLKKIIPEYDVIFSLAGLSGASKSFEHPIIDIDINLKGHINILEACRKSRKKIKVIFPSSRLVYGTPEYIPVDEKHPIKPVSIYAINKYTAEQYYLLYSQLYNINAIVLRISNPYGPYQSFRNHNYGILNNFIHKALNHKSIEIFGDGKQKRDFLYITDLTGLLAQFIQSEDLPNKIFNIGSHNPVELIETVKIIKKYVPNLDYKNVQWPEIDKKIETGDYISDISRAISELKWEPTTNIETGIKKTIDFYYQNLSFYEE